MSAVTFAMVGGGFRSQYFLRIAQALPERFRASGIVVRNPGRATQMRAIWGIPTYPSLEALLGADKPKFLVMAVSPAATPGLLRQAAVAGLPVLTETPPAASLAGLLDVWGLVAAGAQIHVAEQYPNHSTRRASDWRVRVDWARLVKPRSPSHMPIME
jgi:predicted dehydrogenase